VFYCSLLFFFTFFFTFFLTFSSVFSFVFSVFFFLVRDELFASAQLASLDSVSCSWHALTILSSSIGRSSLTHGCMQNVSCSVLWCDRLRRGCNGACIVVVQRESSIPPHLCASTLVSLSLTSVSTLAVCQVRPFRAPHGLSANSFVPRRARSPRGYLRLRLCVLHLRTPRFVPMLFAVYLLAGLVTAARYCIEANPPLPVGDSDLLLSLPECTVGVRRAQANTMLTRLDRVSGN
jgi:hypothetical protein